MLEIMSFLIENKFFVGVVGIAVSSAALGYAMSRYRLAQAHSSQTKPSDIVADAAVKYLMKHAIREPLPLMRLREVSMKHPRHRMIGSADEVQLIRFLIQLVKAEKVIEIGVYTGYNTLSMALGLPPNGKVVACDVTDQFMNDLNAQQYFKEAGVESKIDLRIQPALATLDELISSGESGSYDLVFIDADKTPYEQYYEKSLQLIRKGGLIVVDNTLWGLKVCSPEFVATDDETRAIHNLNLKIHKDTRVEMCMLPMADGVHIVMKL